MEGLLIDIRIVDHCNPKISLYTTELFHRYRIPHNRGFHTSIDITNVLLLTEEILHELG